MSRKFRYVCAFLTAFVAINCFIAWSKSSDKDGEWDSNTVTLKSGNGWQPLAIHQTMDKPWIDGLKMNLTCIAKGFLLSQVELKWDGPGVQQKSLWVIQSSTMQEGDDVIKELAFIPLLSGQAGIYTCNLFSKDSKELLMSEGIVINDKYRGITNSRNTQGFVANTTNEHKSSSWFPAANMCGGERIWKDYANFHSSVLSGKQKAKYLVYDCSHRPCGGHGNRINGITTLLALAMITKRILLIHSIYPVDINNYFSSNAIQWNHAIPRNLKSKSYFLLYTHYYRNYQEFENDLLNPEGPDIMYVRLQWGFYYHLMTFHDKLISKMVSLFSLKTQYDMIFLYGCAFSYLFKYRPEVAKELDTIQSNHGLVTGKYVSMNVRSCLHDGCRYNLFNLKYPWSPTFECAQKAAQALAKKLNVPRVPIFLTADEPAVTAYAKEHYGDQIVLSDAPFYHIDKAEYKGVNADRLNREGFIGVLSDIEMCARAAVLVRSMRSTLSELMGVIHFSSPQTSLHPYDFWQNKSVCEVATLHV